MNAGVYLVIFFYAVQDLRPLSSAIQSLGLSSYVNLSRKALTDIPRCSSLKVILDTVKLTININHGNGPTKTYAPKVCFQAYLNI